jgi:hypothetical protein
MGSIVADLYAEIADAERAGLPPEHAATVRALAGALPLLQGAVEQPLCTYPAEPQARVARLTLDVQLLRILVSVVTQMADHEAQAGVPNHFLQVGLRAALARLGGTLRVERTAYEALDAGALLLRPAPDANAIDFALEGFSPRRAGEGPRRAPRSRRMRR